MIFLNIFVLSSKMQWNIKKGHFEEVDTSISHLLRQQRHYLEMEIALMAL